MLVVRERDPVHWNARHRSWVLTRYDDVAAAFKDQRLASDRVQPVFETKLSPAERLERAPTFKALGLDGPARSSSVGRAMLRIAGVRSPGCSSASGTR